MPRIYSLCAFALLCAVFGCGKKDDSESGGGGSGPPDGQPMVRSRGDDDKKDAVLRLKQIGIALHTYHDIYQSFPAGFVAQKGQLGLSWRVAILPYLKEDALYKQFKLDEPWDSEHNKKLIPKMPKVYESPGTLFANGKTFLRTFSGPAAFIPLTPTGQKSQPFVTSWANQPPGSPARARSMSGFTDGTSNTLMVVEAAEAIEWTRPDDLTFLDPGWAPAGGAKPGPLPKLGFSEGGFYGLMGDGSVRFVKSTTDEKVLRALITVNGGEVVPFGAGEEERPWGGGGKGAPTPDEPTDAKPALPPKGKTKVHEKK